MMTNSMTRWRCGVLAVAVMACLLFDDAPQRPVLMGRRVVVLAEDAGGGDDGDSNGDDESHDCSCTCTGSCRPTATQNVTTAVECKTFCLTSCDTAQTTNPGWRFSCGPVPASFGDCLGGDNLVYSCTAEKYVAARDVVVGDRIRTRRSKRRLAAAADRTTDGRPSPADDDECSAIYHVLKHTGLSRAYAIELDDGTTITLSPNHLVYIVVGITAGDDADEKNNPRQQQQKTIPARKLQQGQILAASLSGDDDGQYGGRQIRSISETMIDLVNLLPFDASTVELNGSVIVSAHSYHETIYGWIYWPIRLMYQYREFSFVADYVRPAVDLLYGYAVAPLAS